MSKLITIDELSEYLQVSKNTLYKWVAAQKITHKKLPNGKVRFDTLEVEKWLRGRTVEVNDFVKLPNDKARSRMSRRDN